MCSCDMCVQPKMIIIINTLLHCNLNGIEEERERERGECMPANEFGTHCTYNLLKNVSTFEVV